MLEQVEKYLLENEKDAVESMMGVLGFSFAGNGQNMAMAFVRLRDWSERQDPSLKVDAVSKRAMLRSRRSAMRRYSPSRRPPS